MFSALKEGVFEPVVAVEYTDDDVGFAAEGQGSGRVVREEVRDQGNGTAETVVVFLEHGKGIAP